MIGIPNWILRLPFVRGWWHRRCPRHIGDAFYAAALKRDPFIKFDQPFWEDERTGA